MPDKKYFVYVPGTTEPTVLSPEDFEAKKQKIYDNYQDAKSVEMTTYNPKEDVGDSNFYVYIPGSSMPTELSAQDFAAKKDKLYAKYPGVEVYRTKNVDYWGDQLRDIYDQINKLQPKAKAADEAYNNPENDWDFTNEDLDPKQAVEAARRSAQLGKDRDNLNAQLENLYRLREKNPVWKKYWQDTISGLEETDRLLSDAQVKMQKEHPEDYEHYEKANRLARSGPKGAGLAAVEALKSNKDFNTSYESLAAARMMLDDAKKIASAPARYDDEGSAAGDFLKGVVDNATGAVSMANLIKTGLNMHLINAVKKIQQQEDGEQTNIMELVKKDYFDDLGYLNEGEKALVKAFVKKAEVEAGRAGLISRSYQAGQGAIESLGFMADFVMAGGFGEAAASKTVGKLVEKAGEKQLAKFGAETLYGTVKAMAMTPIMPSTYNNFVNNLLQFNDAGGVDLSGKALLKSAGDAIIENTSELVGSAPLEILKMPFGKIKFPDWSKALTNSPIMKSLKRAGYNGFFEEMVEEWTGNAARVMTGVDKDALSDFATIDQQLITAGSFAPMSLFGFGVSLGQYTAASRSMKKAGVPLEELMKNAGLSEDEIKTSLDTKKYETPEELGHHMTEVYKSIVQNNPEAAADAYLAVMNYTKAASRYNIVDCMFNELKDAERTDRLMEINKNTGVEDWHHKNADGIESVRIIVDQDGAEQYVMGEDDTNISVINSEGGRSFISKADLMQGLQDGTMSDSGEMGLYDYLDKSVQINKEARDQQRMQAEQEESREEVLNSVQPGMSINIGSVEEPNNAIVLQLQGDMVIVQDQEGNVRQLTVEQVGNMLGVQPPKSEEQIEEENAEEIEKQTAGRELGNTFKGSAFVTPEGQFTLIGVVKGEETPYEVMAKDTEGNDVSLPMSQEEYDSMLSQFQNQPVETPEVQPEPADDGTLRDIHGNPIPMRTNSVTGEQVVDQDALWNNDPEAWAAWNDSQPVQRTTSKEKLEHNIKKLTKKIQSSQKEIHKLALDGGNPEEIDQKEGEMADDVKRLELLNSILAKYNAPVVASEEGLNAEKRKAEAEQTIFQQKEGFPGIQQRWQAAPKIEGAADEIRLANGETISGKYVLTEADAATPSHNPAQGFKMSDGFPVDENGKTVNDRDYEHDKAAAQAVVDKAGQYDQRALQTPVIVSEDGVVLSGNDRTMAGQIAATMNTDGAYVDYLRKYSQKYGFTDWQVNQFTHPRVVFVPDEKLPYDAQTFAKFNAEEKKSQNKIEKAVKVGKAISIDALGKLATLINEYEDVNALYNDAKGVDGVLSILLADGIITKEQLAALKEGDLLSGTGMDLLESTLMGAALDEAAVRVAMNDRRLRKPIISAIAQIITNNTIEGYNLRTELTDAVVLVANGKSAGEIKAGESVQSYIRQQHLFVDDVVASATVQMLADAINSNKTSFLKNVLSLYNRDAIDAANGQMNLLTGDVPSRDAILRDILQYLGYDTTIIFDTAEREAEQRAANERTEQPEESETGTPVQSDEGSSVDRERAAAIFGESDINEYGFDERLSDEEIAEFLRLYDAAVPANEAVGQAYQDLQKELKSKDKEVKKAAEDKIHALELAQEEAYAPVQEYVDSLIDKYGMVENEEEPVEEGFEDEIESEEVEPDEPKPKKGKGKKAETKPYVVKGGASEDTIAKQTYTQEEYEEFIYGRGSFSKFQSKKTGEIIQIYCVDDTHPIYHDHSVRVRRTLGDMMTETVATTDYIIKYMKANKFKCIDKEADKAHKNKYGYWVNKYGVIRNPIRIELPSVKKGWAVQAEVSFGQKDDGKWYVGGSANYATGGGSIGVKSGPYETKSDAIRALIEALERFRKAHPGNHWTLKDCDNLIKTLKGKTLPQALLEEGVVSSVSRAEIVPSEYDDAEQGLLFAEETGMEEKPKKKAKKAKVKVQTEAEPTLIETEEEEAEPKFELESEEGSEGNYHWMGERVCTNPTIITMPGLDRLGNVPKVALAEKDGKWYASTYFVDDSGKGTQFGNVIPDFRGSFIPYESRKEAIEKAIASFRFSMNQAQKNKAAYGETYNGVKELIDYLTKMELTPEPAPEKKETSKADMADAIDYLKKAIDVAEKSENYARLVNVVKSYKDAFGEEIAKEFDSILADFRMAGLTKQSKQQMTEKVADVYRRITGEEKKVEAPAYGSKNTVVTTERYEELKKKMKERLGQLNAGFDPTIFAIGVEMAAYHVEAGARKFADFSKRMVDELGDAIRPYLRAIYNGARDLPGMESVKDEMDSPDVVAKANIDTIGKQENWESRRDNGIAGGDIQGFENMTEYNILEECDNYIEELKNNGLNIAVVDMKVIGSRAFGSAKADSDLDVLVEYKGDMKEDAVFNALNAEPLTILGIQVDFFPIKQSMTEWLETHDNGRPVEKKEASEPVVKQVDVNGLFGAISDMYAGKRGPVKISDFATPVEEEIETPAEEQPSETSGQLGEIGKYTHTKTGQEMTIVRLTGERLSSDDFRKLKAKAKELGGYYSSYGSSKGFLFENEEDAIKFNTINIHENEEQTDEQTAADTAVIVREAASVAEQAESLAETEEPVEPERANKLIDTIDTALEVVDDQLALLGFYEADQTGQSHESYGYMKSAEKKAVKDADKLARKLAADLGIEVGRKKLAEANIAPAGGEVYFRLPLNEGMELYVNIDVVPDRDDNLYIGGVMGRHLSIMYRVENPNAKGQSKYVTANAFAPYNVPYADFLRRVKYEAKDYLPEAPAVEPGKTDLLEVAKTQAEKSRKSQKKEVSSQSGDEYLGSLFDTLSNDEVEEEVVNAPIERTKPTEQNGYKIGEKVLYTAYNGRQQEATIYDFDNDKVVLDTGMAPVIYEEVDFDSIKPLKTEDNGLQGNDEVRTEGLSGNDSGQGRDQAAAEGGNGEAAEQESGRADTGREEGSRLDSQPGRSVRRLPRLSGQNKRNNRVSKGEVVYPKTPAARFKANVAAIRLLKELQDSGKQATKEQMAVLRQYTGWGGLGSYFNNSYSAENRELKSLLTDEEMQAAELSINTAYYTPTEIIDSMWDIAKRLGFEGGKILEGSAGIGNILASMPKNMSDQSAITAVELDPITGGILEQLYPDADVRIKGFQDVEIPNNSVDLAITNVPFGNIQMYDAKEKDLSRKFGGKIHDFCIAKNVRKLREGGLGIFISTRGTLDASSKELRQWIVNEGNADVIGAFRLNNATFEGTKATSDIIVIRKRVSGEKSPNAIDVTGTTITRREDYNTGEREWNRNSRQYEAIIKKCAMEMNDYFVEHPENMGGEMGFGYEHGDTYRPASSGLWPTEKIDQSKRLAKWVKSFNPQEISQTEEVQEENEATTTKEGQIIVNSKGDICVSRQGKAVPIGTNSNKVKGYSKKQVVSDYDALKNAINETLDYQLKNESDEGLKPLLTKLNRAYDSFVRKYGYLHKNISLAWLRNDVDYSATAAVEDYKETKTVDGKVTPKVTKTNIFSGRVLGAKRVPTPKDVKDGVIISMNQYGRVDLPFIADALKKDEEDVKKEIISSGLGFENPQSGNVEVDYEYLSGNVREKLEYAKEHNTDGKYDKNIEALEKAVPADIPAHLIEFSLGSDWMPTELYTKYAMDKFGVSDKFVPNLIGGEWSIPDNAAWEMNLGTEQNRAAGVHSEQLRMDRKGHELFIAAMNNTGVVFSRSYKDDSGKTVTEYDREAMQAATVKISDMRDDFKEWCRGKMLAEPELAERIQKTYNDTFNSIVPKEISEVFIPEHFEGQVLELKPGKPFHLRPHQAKAVIRATTEPVMLAHEVGSGKTYTLISSAMEMRRLGTAKKPMIVVQNSTLGQFVSSAKELYPNAKVLTINEKDRTVEGRTAFYAKIKYNDWDIIIIPQSVFDLIPDSEERQRAFIQEKINEKMFVLEQAKAAKNSSAEKKLKQELADLEYERDFGEKPKKKKDSKKEAEAKENAAVKAKKQLDRKTDDVSNFDDMGIDALLIDEAHSYKHLGFSTSMQRGVKGVDASTSKRSAGAYLKIRSVFDKVGWKNVVFATGTPISNTAAEIWTFMKYLMPADEMRRNHIYYFDDFVRNFGTISQNLEFTTSGKFKENTRFAAYQNLPELIRIWSSVSDTVLSKDAIASKAADGEVKKLEDELPVMETWTDDKGEVHVNQARDIYLPQSPSLIDIMTAVRAKLEWYEELTGKEKKEYSYIPLKMYGIAKMAAIDPRLVDKNAIDEQYSKTNKVVEETLKALEDSKKYNGTCALFSDNFRRKDYVDGKDVIGFNLFDEIKRKLIEKGVPAEQIVIIDNQSIEQKERIFAKVNNGEVRVIMGSTAKLGTGVNIQERLFFEAHIDAPNRPMDYTQRTGRILRQGNLHKEWGIPVRVVRFGVEDSLDVTAYQRLSTKSKFINSVMDGKPLIANGMESRVLEETDEGDFDNPVAVLSGSEYAMLKSQAERELRKLKNKKEQHRQDQIYIERTLKSNDSLIKYNEKSIAENKSMLDKAHEMFPDGVVKEITIEGKKAKSQTEIAETIKEKITAPIRERLEKRRKDYGFESEKLHYTLSFDNVPVTLTVSIYRTQEYDDRTREFTTKMKTYLDYSCPTFNIEGAIVPGGYVAVKDALTSFETDVVTGKRFESSIANLENSNERLRKDNELMLERRGKPFTEEDKLKKQEELVKDYTEKMREEMAVKEAKYAEQIKNAKTTFNVDEVEIDDEDDEDEDESAEFADYLPTTQLSGIEDRKEGESAWDFVSRVKEAAAAKYPFFAKETRVVRVANEERNGKEKGTLKMGYYSAKTKIISIFAWNRLYSADSGMLTLYHEGIHKALDLIDKDKAKMFKNFFNISLMATGYYSQEEYQTLFDDLMLSYTEKKGKKQSKSTIREEMVANELSRFMLAGAVDAYLTGAEQYKDTEAFVEVFNEILNIIGYDRKEEAKRFNEGVLFESRDERLRKAKLRISGAANVGNSGSEQVSGDRGNAGGQGTTGADQKWRAVAADLVSRYENQDGEKYPWLSEYELMELVSDELPKNSETEELLNMVEQYQTMAEEDFAEGRRDFTGGEMQDLFDNFLSKLIAYSKGDLVRNRLAYHGTGASFESFDSSHMGEGEGAQAHGWGHYVALNEDVSRDYAKRMGGADWVVESQKKELEYEKEYARLEYKSHGIIGRLLNKKTYENALADIERREREIAGSRNLYTVEIPDDNGTNYLDEQKELSKEQRNIIAEALRALPEDAWKISADEAMLFNDHTAAQLANSLSKRLLNGYEMYSELTHGLGSKKAASEFLSDAGFVGIKYDGRRDGPCAVIFKDDDVKIVEHEQFREGKDSFEINPKNYNESIGGKRLAVNETATKCGVDIQFLPSREMMFNGKPLAGRWIDGKMYICLEHCLDRNDAVRTVLHEGVGHNGLRKLVGNENMRAFCLDLFQKLPAKAREEIAAASVNKYGGNTAEAVEEYLAERAEVMDLDNEESRSLWDIVRDAIRNLLAKIGINVPLSNRDVRWLMYQSYMANKQSDVLNEVKRQVVANRLGFTLSQQGNRVEAQQLTRNKIAAESLAPAARMYNMEVMNWMSRLRETWVDKDDSVGRLVSAIEKATNNKAKAFEDVRLALNQQSSKGLAAIEKFEREEYYPMMDAIMSLMKEKGCALHDVERYAMIKHGLERNEIFAQRDAREYYKSAHDTLVQYIKDNDELSEADKKFLIEKEDEKLKKHYDAIKAGTDSKYLEFRKQDYGGLTAMYSEWDSFEPFREGIESEEEYQARVLSARHPKYTYFDANGKEQVDMAETERAAQEEVDEFERGYESEIADLWKKINSATKSTLKHQYDANMMSREQYNQVKDMFQYYVPLRGFADNTAEDMYDYYRSSQTNDFTPPLLKAKGRKTEAESPFGYIGAMASSAIAADMKNETKLALYYFVSNRAANDLVNISEVWYEKTGEDSKGKAIYSPVYPPFKEDLSSDDAKKAYEEWEKGMEEKAEKGLAFSGKRKLNLHNSVIHIDNSQKASHVITFKVGGKDMMMYINGNPRAAQAINNELNVEMSADYQRFFGKILRWFSGINTSYNPEFWLSNAQRDALFALMSVNVKEDSAYNHAFRRNFRKLLGRTLLPGAKGGAFSLLKKLQKGKLDDSHLDTMYKEFVENGGVTGYTVLKNNEEWEQELRKYTGSTRQKVKAVKSVFESIQKFGEAIEQLTRFAAYMTSREQGKEIKDAVNDAKELTVNFNRKGSGKSISFKEAGRLRTKDGKKLNPVQRALVVGASWLPVYGRRFIMFFNASTQGLNAMYKLYKKNPTQMGLWTAGYLALGVIQAILHGMMDDDDDYLDIPDYERRNNLLLGGNGVYFKWALPQECRVFYGLGDMIVNHAMGREPHKSIAGELLNSMSDVAPLNAAGGPAAVAPSALTPVVEVIMNRDYKGSKIYNDMKYLSDEERERTPSYQKAYQGTGRPYILISQFFNWLSGGDYADAGWININPATVEHLIQGATGGAGTTIGKFYRGTLGQFFGEDFSVRNTPFLSRILTINDDRYRNAHTTELFDYYKAEAEHTDKMIKTYRKEGDSEKLNKILDSKDFEIMHVYNGYKKLFKFYNDELKSATDRTERKSIMREQDELRKEMIKEISNIDK